MDWGTDLNYSIVIKTYATGLYYDFSFVSEGENTKANDIYQCYKR